MASANFTLQRLDRYMSCLARRDNKFQGVDQSLIKQCALLIRIGMVKVCMGYSQYWIAAAERRANPLPGTVCSIAWRWNGLCAGVSVWNDCLFDAVRALSHDWQLVRWPDVRSPQYTQRHVISRQRPHRRPHPLRAASWTIRGQYESRLKDRKATCSVSCAAFDQMPSWVIDCCSAFNEAENWCYIAAGFTPLNHWYTLARYIFAVLLRIMFAQYC